MPQVRHRKEFDDKEYKKFMDNVIDELIQLSRKIGREELELVLPTEGCVSARIGQDEFVTSSMGSQLATLTPKDLVNCRLKEAASLVDLQFLRPAELMVELAKSKIGDSEKMPGMDAALHAWLLSQEDIRFVAQAHPTACLKVLCSPSADKFADNRMFIHEIRDCGSRSTFVPFADPGVALAREVRSRVLLSSRQHQHGRAPQVVLVQNFGVLILGKTAQQTWDALRMVNKAASVLEGTARLGGVVFIPQPIVRRLIIELNEPTATARSRPAK
jgi:rhamnose utilization protein RhaD (predicted bifunctional aldolase and dehydrogenase)